MSSAIHLTPVQETFELCIDPRITDPESYRVSFLILLDGDLVMSPEHLGVAYMTSVLRAVGFTVEIREVTHSNREATLQGLAAFDPRLVCFTLMSLNMVSCVEFCAALRERMPDVVIACGGPAGTYAGLSVLKNNPYADIVAVGEGEPTILDLVQRLYLQEDLSLCAGICYRDAQGGLHENPLRSLIHNSLDVLPYPARDQLELHGNKLEYVRVSTSRGCVARCTFCSAPNVGNKIQKGKAWRGRSPQSVIDEVAGIVHKHNFRTFDFVDSTFEDPDGGRIGKQRIAEIAQGFLDQKLDIYYNCCMRAENWSDDDHELLDLLVRSGLEKVNVGIESGVASELLLWDKRATVEDNIRIIRLLRDHGIYLAMGFIPFHPYATYETLVENAQFLRDYCGHNLRRMTERLEIYPGTPIITRMSSDGLVKDSYWDMLDPYGYTFKDERVARLAIHFASLYNNGDYHQRGVITEQSAVFAFETFNVVLQTFISRIYRRFHHIPGVNDMLEGFKGFVHTVRQEMGQFNYAFFMQNLEDVLNERLSPDKQEQQTEAVERYFRQRMHQIQSEQLRVGRAMYRMGVPIGQISSKIEPTGFGAPRTYTGGGSPNW